VKKSFELDFYALRKPLLFSVTLLITGIALVFGSVQFRNSMSTDKHHQEENLQELVNDYQALINSERIIETLYGRYKILKKTGFIGTEPRLQWLESLRRTGENSGVIAMQYHLHAQRPYSQRPLIDGGDYQLYASTMDLQVDVLHEGHLLEFLDRLYDAGVGVLDIRGCTIQRLGSDGVQPNEANVRADCKLSWYTIRQDVGGSPGEEFM